jgi:TRAP-type C4-dicarboxylate transport system permease large subunit
MKELFDLSGKVALITGASTGLGDQPPVGSVLFVGTGIAGTTIQKVIKPLLPLFFAMALALFLITYIPELSLFLPKFFGY